MGFNYGMETGLKKNKTSWFNNVCEGSFAQNALRGTYARYHQVLYGMFVRRSWLAPEKSRCVKRKCVA